MIFEKTNKIFTERWITLFVVIFLVVTWPFDLYKQEMTFRENEKHPHEFKCPFSVFVFDSESGKRCNEFKKLSGILKAFNGVSYSSYRPGRIDIKFIHSEQVVIEAALLISIFLVWFVVLLSACENMENNEFELSKFETSVDDENCSLYYWTQSLKCSSSASFDEWITGFESRYSQDQLRAMKNGFTSGQLIRNYKEEVKKRSLFNRLCIYYGVIRITNLELTAQKRAKVI